MPGPPRRLRAVAARPVLRRAPRSCRRQPEVARHGEVPDVGVAELAVDVHDADGGDGGRALLGDDAVRLARARLPDGEAVGGLLLLDRLPVGVEQEGLVRRGDLGQGGTCRRAGRVDDEEPELVVVAVGDDGYVDPATGQAQAVGDVDVVVTTCDRVAARRLGGRQRLDLAGAHVVDAEATLLGRHDHHGLAGVRRVDPDRRIVTGGVPAGPVVVQHRGFVVGGHDRRPGDGGGVHLHRGEQRSGDGGHRRDGAQGVRHAPTLRYGDCRRPSGGLPGVELAGYCGFTARHSQASCTPARLSR